MHDRNNILDRRWGGGGLQYSLEGVLKGPFISVSGVSKTALRVCVCKTIVKKYVNEVEFEEESGR